MRAVVSDWGLAWEQVNSPDPVALADRVYSAFMGNHYGIRDEIFHDFEKALGATGIEIIEQRLKEALATQKSDSYHQSTIRIGLTHIAEIKQDMDMYIEHKTDSGKYFNGILLSDIVQKFLACGRAEEAIEWLTQYKGTDNQASQHDYLMLEANQKLGNLEAVKESHWQLFTKHLDLKDFEAVIKLSDAKACKDYTKKAIQTALKYHNVSSAVNFLLAINELSSAIALFHQKYNSIDGEWYDELKNMAKLFEKQQCYLEAILIYRRLAESILDRAKSKIYHYAVSYIEKAQKLAEKVDNWQQYPTSPIFIEEIRQAHKLKRAFWAQYDK